MRVSVEEEADKTAKGKSFTCDPREDSSFAGVVFLKHRARQLLKAMFEIDVLHWIAVTLNPRTRMLKLATDVERIHAHSLVHSELAKIIDGSRS